MDDVESVDGRRGEGEGQRQGQQSLLSANGLPALRIYIHRRVTKGSASAARLESPKTGRTTEHRNAVIPLIIDSFGNDGEEIR